MSQTNWEADKMLDVYIHDYFVKRKLHASAKAFKQEGKISTEPVAIDAPGGFLFEWWSVFWDIFISRTNDKHSEAATSYIQTQVSKAREQQQKSQQQQMQMQQIMMRRQQQLQEQQHPQRRIGIPNSDPMMRQNPGGTANALATKMYEEKLKLPPQSDPSDDVKYAFSDNIDAGSYMLGIPPVNMQQFTRSSQFPLSPRHGGPPGSEGSFMGIPGANQGGNSLTLKGWPLMGLDNLRPCLASQQKTMIQSPRSMNEMQQQMFLQAQAQQSLASPSVDLETKNLRMMLANNRNVQQQLPNNQQQSQNPQNVMSTPSPQVSNQMNQPDKIGGGSDQASKSQMGRKRKQPVSSSAGPANSSGTANTAEPSPGSAPSTPSTHTPPGDAMSMQNLPLSGVASKPPLMFGSDSVGTLISATDQVLEKLIKADDGTLDDNVASFLSHEEGDARDAMWRTMDENRARIFS